MSRRDRTDHRPVESGAQGVSSDDPAVACSLDGEEMRAQIAAWKRLVADAAWREETIGGVRLHFGDPTIARQLVQLATDELGCCAFFRFTLSIDRKGVVLHVTAPPAGEPLTQWLFGEAA